MVKWISWVQPPQLTPLTVALSCRATGISEGDPGPAEESGPRKAEEWTPPKAAW